MSNGFITPGLFGDSGRFVTSPVYIEPEEPPVPSIIRPGEAFSHADIVSLLTADSIEVAYGAELLDADGNVTAVITDDLISATIEHDGKADVPGTVTASIIGERAWDSDRARFFQKITAGQFYKQWYMGVFTLVSPNVELYESPLMYDVTGYSLLSFLNRPCGDTYQVLSGTDALTAVEQVVNACGVTGTRCLFDYSGTQNLSADMVWVLDSNATTWLQIANDILKSINYRPLWEDGRGVLRSEPYQSPATATPFFTFDLGQVATNIIGERRRHSKDEWDRTNYFTFIRTGTQRLPVVGDGLYIVDNSNGGVKYKRPVYCDVNDQTALEAKGNEEVTKASSRKETIEVPCGPLPLVVDNHLGVVDYWDGEAGGYKKCQVVGWSAPLDGSDYTLTLEVVA